MSEIGRIIKQARDQARLTALDFAKGIFEDFVELHGDRNFRDDGAVISGVGRLGKQPVTVIGIQKGKNLQDNLKRNFGQPHPEGYRKALRLMKQAEKFGRPVVTFINTAGAYPGLGAEERGQGEAIARNLLEMSDLKVPIIAIIIGEGGSGGAVAFATANRIAMLEHSVYSVISPEGCASILWKDAEKMREAAEALRLTAQDLQKLGVIDRIVKEPMGGAQRGRKETIEAVGKAVETMLKELSGKKPEALIKDRRQKFLDMGSKGLAA